MVGTMNAVQVQLLGAPRATRDENEIAFVPDMRYRSLAYLAYRGDWVGREELAYLFWADAPPDTARHNLRQLVKRLRRLEWLPDLEITPHQLRWPVASDVAAFREALGAERWADAASGYNGPLLANLDDPQPGEFQHWLEHERGQLRERWREALLRVADDLEGQLRFEDAAAALARLLDDDELDEEVLQRTMELLASSGRAGEALAAYRGFAERLRDELDLEPSSATEQLAGDIENRRIEAEPARRQQPPSAVAVAPERPTLPVPATPFVGRDLELSEISHQLSQPGCRLLTLTGPGGIGKTRLALQAADELRSRFPDGVAFVPLEALTSPEAITTQIASALGFDLVGRADPSEQLAGRIGNRRLLLVLDNFEHLSEEAGVAAELLRACKQLTLLVTSRERLRLEEEWLLPLEGLSSPEGDDLGVEDILSFDAPNLFLQCAQRLRPGYRPADSEAPALLAICRAVGGSPLGVELAAAWVRALPLADIATEIARNIDILASDRRNVSARHRSARAAFDHSWALLTEGEQEALAKLAVFHGGFRREAAAAIADVSLPVLMALLDKSLLRSSADGRFDLHPLIFQFTREALQQRPAELASRAERHARYYLRLLEEQGKDLSGVGHARAKTVIGEDLPNILEAWSWAIASDRPEVLKRTCQPLCNYYYLQNRVPEGVEVFAQSIHDLERRADAPPALLGLLLGFQAAFDLRLGQTDRAERAAHLSIERLKGQGEPMGVVRALSMLSGVAVARGQLDQARAFSRRELALARKHQLQEAVLRTLGNLAVDEQDQGNYRQAEAHNQEILRSFRQSGNHALTIQTLNNLGHLHLDMHETHKAQAFLHEGLELAREHGILKNLQHLFGGLGKAASDQGHLEEARGLLETALKHSRKAGDTRHLANLLPNLGQVVTRLGDEDQGRRYLLEGLRIAWETDNVRAALNTLTLLAELDTEHFQPDTAARTLRLVLSHPASKGKTKEAAQALLEKLGAPPEGTVADLEQVVTGLLERVEG